MKYDIIIEENVEINEDCKIDEVIWIYDWLEIKVEIGEELNIMVD